MPPLSALIAAALASVPGFALSFYLLNGRRLPAAQAWAAFAANAPVVLPIYGIGALLYGTVLWLVLRAIGHLHLSGLLIGSVVPVLVLVFGHIIMRGGAGPGLPVVLFGLCLPCLIMAFALWCFAVRWPLGT